MTAFLTILLLATVAVALYLFMHEDRSKHIREEMTALIGDMQITDEWKQEARQILDSVHEKAFDAALDVTQKLGKKFDINTYYDKVFEMMEQRARDAGKPELAEKLEEQKALFTLSVVEK